MDLQENTVAQEVSQGPFDQGWEDRGGQIDETDRESPSQTREGESQEEIDSPENRIAAGGEELIKLRHLGEERAVTPEEMRVLAQKGLDYDRVRSRLQEARETIQKLGGDRPVPAAADRPTVGEARRRDLLEFVRAFPQVGAASIPAEVWASARGGESLTAAYARYQDRLLRGQVTDLRERLAAAENEREGAARSAGSMAGAGSGRRPDPFEEGWDWGF